MSGETLGWMVMGGFIACVGVLMYILSVLQDRQLVRWPGECRTGNPIKEERP